VADQRLKGQEVQVQVVVGGQLSDAFTAIASFSDTMKMESMEAGYLGEVTNRTDDIFNGWDGTLSMHVSKQKWMEFQALIKARAQRAQPDLVFNLVRTDFYPNGETPTRTYKDVAFGAEPTNVASRGDYVSVDVPFMCSDTDDNLQQIL
jgi:hypothetical protein